MEFTNTTAVGARYHLPAHVPAGRQRVRLAINAMASTALQTIE